MLIKRADDRSRELALLKDAANSQTLDKRQQDWARERLETLRRGIQGERDAAHYLDNYFADGRNHAVIHDLRLIDGEDMAQIDHLVISRTFDFYLLETKNYNGSVRINDRGEFSVRYGRREYGIPSPLEQSRRHERVLLKSLDKLGISGRVSKRPAIHHLVLFHPKATISLPSAKTFDTSMVLKADQFGAWHQRHIEKDGSIAATITGVLNVRSSETLESWGKLLVRLHRPADLPALPGQLVRSDQSSSQPTRSTAAQRDQGSERRQGTCSACGKSLSPRVQEYCRDHATRFAGRQFCIDHQAAIKS